MKPNERMEILRAEYDGKPPIAPTWRNRERRRMRRVQVLTLVVVCLIKWWLT